MDTQMTKEETETSRKRMRRNSISKSKRKIPWKKK